MLSVNVCSDQSEGMIPYQWCGSGAAVVSNLVF